MINIIYGPKGFGKTKIIIDRANEISKKAKGTTAFVTDNSTYNFNIVREVRMINTKDFKIENACQLTGFLCGMLAKDHDLEYIFLDGAARISGMALAEMKPFYEKLEFLSKTFGTNFVLTVSAAKEDIPKFILKYAKV